MKRKEINLEPLENVRFFPVQQIFVSYVLILNLSIEFHFV